MNSNKHNVVRPGFVNLDFADVRAVLREAGPALIGIGRASGEERAREAARQATANPLLEVGIGGARTVLLHVSGPPELSLGEVSRAAEEVRAQVDPRADVLFGASVDERLGDEVRVTVVATGLGPPGGARAGAGAAASAEGGASGPATRRVGSAAEGATVAAAAPSTAADEAEVPGFLVGDGPRATPRSASR